MRQNEIVFCGCCGRNLTAEAYDQHLPCRQYAARYMTERVATPLERLCWACDQWVELTHFAHHRYQVHG